MSAIQQAIDAMKQDPRRELYLGRDGYYYVTYSNGTIPAIHRESVTKALDDGVIFEKYKGFYGIKEQKP